MTEQPSLGARVFQPLSSREIAKMARADSWWRSLGVRVAPVCGGGMLSVLAACAHHRDPETAAPPASGREVLNPPGLAPLVPAYSVAIRSGDQVFVSGMTGVKPGTQDIVDGGAEAQTRQTLENIRTALQSGGATMADVDECTVFLKDMADYAAMNAVYIEFFRTAPPARATVSVTALPRPAALVEIKCSARIRKP